MMRALSRKKWMLVFYYIFFLGCSRASFKIAGEDLSGAIRPGDDALRGNGPGVLVKVNGSEQNISVAKGSEVVISWESKGTTECVVAINDQRIGDGVSGATKSIVSVPITITALCKTPASEIKDDISVSVDNIPTPNPNVPVILDGTEGDTMKSLGLKAQLRLNGVEDSIEITYGSNVEVSWSSIGADSCTVEPQAVGKLEGTLMLEKVTSNTNVTLNCNNSLGNVKVTRTVTVTPPGPPIADLKINGSQGPLVAPPGTPLKVSWISVLATACDLTISGSPAANVPLQGELDKIAIDQIVVYTLRCTGPGGTTSDSVSVVPNMSPPTVVLTAQGQRSILEVPLGSMVKLDWVSQNAARCFIMPGQYSGVSGSQIVGPISGLVTYTALCEGPFGMASDTVKIAPNGTALLLGLLVNGSASEVTVAKNSTVKVTWASTNARSCQIMPFGFDGLSGTDRLSPALSQSLKVTLTCLNSQNMSQSISISVIVTDSGTPPVKVPKVDLKVNGSDGPLYVDANKGVQLVWTTENVTDCKLNGSSVGASGSMDRTIVSDIKMIISCKGGAAEVVDEVMILVRKKGVAACKVGISIKDGGEWGYVRDPVLGSKNPGCFHGVSVCATRGHFKVFGQEVQSLSDQDVEFRISKLSSCDHQVQINVKNPNSYSAGYQSSHTSAIKVQLKKGQTVEVNITNTKSCNDLKTRNSLDPQWSKVTPNMCLR